MDRAARAVRRSSVKLLSLGGGHSELNILLSEIKDMRNTAKAFMNAQNAASQDLLKWTANEQNRALQDVANQLAELNLLWSEVQREFVEGLKDYRHMFEMVLEGEKHVSQAKVNHAACEAREAKIKKELKKAFKKAPASEVEALENRLAQAERAKDLAQLEVTDRSRENEAVKLIRIKEGLLKLSEAYIDFSKKCTVIFEAQRDIAYQLPDVHQQDLDEIKYTGSGATKFYVQQAKEQIRQHRRQTKQLPQSYQVGFEEPPPPYSPGDYISGDPSPFLPQTRLEGGVGSGGGGGSDASSVSSAQTRNKYLSSDTSSLSSMQRSDYISTDTSSFPPPLPPAPSMASENLSPRRRSNWVAPRRQDTVDTSDTVDLDTGVDSECEDDLTGAMGGIKI